MIRLWQFLLLAIALLAPTAAWADSNDKVSDRQLDNGLATYRTVDDGGYRDGRAIYSYDRDDYRRWHRHHHRHHHHHHGYYWG